MDRHLFSVSGASGEVRWGYHCAMEIAQWKFAGSGSAGGTLTGKVVRAHDFPLSQSPLQVVLELSPLDAEQARLVAFFGGSVGPRSVVKWPVRSVVHQDGVASIEVGPVHRESPGGVRHG